MPTKIEWAEETWNPVTGCTKLSEGCAHCYAERMAKRLAGRNGYPADSPFRVTLHLDRLQVPMHWRKPRMVFVDSMGDLFHEHVPDWFIEKVFETMAIASHHTFLVLTKRADRLLANRTALFSTVLPNVWLGVTAENQQQAMRRIPHLLETPAAVRFVSVEPMLGPINAALWLPFFPFLSRLDRESIGTPALDWVIVGGETGPGARVMAPEWARSLRDQCVEAGVPFFFKKWGDWKPGRLSVGSMERAGWQPLPVRHGGRLLDGREWNEIPGQG